MGRFRVSATQLLVCVENKGYRVSLKKRKIYLSLPDPTAAKHGQVRVIDESGDDYLYPKRFFRPIKLDLVEMLDELKDKQLLRGIARARSDYAKGKAVLAERLFKKMGL